MHFQGSLELASLLFTWRFKKQVQIPQKSLNNICPFKGGQELTMLMKKHLQVNDCIWAGKHLVWTRNAMSYIHNIGKGFLQCTLRNTISYLCMSRPHMDLSLWKIALLRWHRGTEINSDILRDMKIRSPLVVIHFLNWKGKHRILRIQEPVF